MKFEDFFKQTGPSNYVEYPPKKVPTLEQFFAERVPQPKVQESPIPKIPAIPKTEVPIKKELSPLKNKVEAISSVTPKITSQEVKTIKEEVAPEQLTTADMSSEPVKEEPIVPSKEVSREPASQGPDSEFWLGLLPIAADVLTGGTGAGLNIASKYYLSEAEKQQKRKQTLEDKLLELQKEQIKQEGKKGLKTLEVDVEGKPIITPVEEAIGKQAWKSPAKSGMTFAERADLERLKFGLKSKLEEGKASKEEKKRLQDIEMKLSEKWEQDPFTRDTRTVAAAYNSLSKINPESLDPIKDISAIFDFMKTLDPKSVVRESEQQLVMGAKSVQDIMNNLFEIKSGQRMLTPDQIRGIQKFAANNYQRRLESQRSVIDEQFRKKAKKYGVDPDMIIGDLSVGTPVLWQNTKTKKWSILPLSEEDADYAIKNLGAQKVK